MAPNQYSALLPFMRPFGAGGDDKGHTALEAHRRSLCSMGSLYTATTYDLAFHVPVPSSPYRLAGWGTSATLVMPPAYAQNIQCPDFAADQAAMRACAVHHENDPADNFISSCLTMSPAKCGPRKINKGTPDDWDSKGLYIKQTVLPGSCNQLSREVTAVENGETQGHHLMSCMKTLQGELSQGTAAAISKHMGDICTSTASPPGASQKLACMDYCRLYCRPVAGRQSSGEVVSMAGGLRGDGKSSKATWQKCNASAITHSLSPGGWCGVFMKQQCTAGSTKDCTSAGTGLIGLNDLQGSCMTMCSCFAPPAIQLKRMSGWKNAHEFIRSSVTGDNPFCNGQLTGCTFGSTGGGDGGWGYTYVPHAYATDTKCKTGCGAQVCAIQVGGDMNIAAGAQGHLCVNKMQCTTKAQMCSAAPFAPPQVADTKQLSAAREALYGDVDSIKMHSTNTTSVRRVFPPSAPPQRTPSKCMITPPGKCKHHGSSHWQPIPEVVFNDEDHGGPAATDEAACSARAKSWQSFCVYDSAPVHRFVAAEPAKVPHMDEAVNLFLMSGMSTSSCLKAHPPVCDPSTHNKALAKAPQRAAVQVPFDAMDSSLHGAIADDIHHYSSGTDHITPGKCAQLSSSWAKACNYDCSSLFTASTNKHTTASATHISTTTTMTTAGGQCTIMPRWAFSMVPCDVHDAAQRFTYDKSRGVLRSLSANPICIRVDGKMSDLQTTLSTCDTEWAAGGHTAFGMVHSGDHVSFPIKHTHEMTSNVAAKTALGEPTITKQGTDMLLARTGSTPAGLGVGDAHTDHTKWKLITLPGAESYFELRHDDGVVHFQQINTVINGTVACVSTAADTDSLLHQHAGCPSGSSHVIVVGNINEANTKQFSGFSGAVRATAGFNDRLSLTSKFVRSCAYRCVQQALVGNYATACTGFKYDAGMCTFYGDGSGGGTHEGSACARAPLQVDVPTPPTGSDNITAATPLIGAPDPRAVVSHAAPQFTAATKVIAHPTEEHSDTSVMLYAVPCFLLVLLVVAIAMARKKKL